jgi:hypothetical protein
MVKILLTFLYRAQQSGEKVGSVDGRNDREPLAALLPPRAYSYFLSSKTICTQGFIGSSREAKLKKSLILLTGGL